MSPKTTSFSFKYKASDILEEWSRSHLSASLIASLIPQKLNSPYLINIISTLMNEYIEFCCKYGVNKDKYYSIATQHTSNTLHYLLSFQLQSKDAIYLRYLINEIKNNCKSKTTSPITFNPPLLNLKQAIYLAIQYKTDLSISSPTKNNSPCVKQLSLSIKLNLKDHVL